jgi:arylsulfatase A-like enzyme
MAAGRGAFAAQAAPRRPSIVFILMDDLGWTDVGYMGSEYYETPNIDRLARQGMVFTNAYTNAPNCAPTRASLLSGQYTPRHGVYTVGSSERGSSRHRRLIPVANTTDLSTDIVTIPEVLGPAGYVSACIGKWHLGGGPEHSPTAQGFDVSFDRSQAGYGGGHFSPPLTRRLNPGQPREYLTDRLTDEALRFVDANQDRSFFLYLAHHAVHTPLEAQEDLIAKYRNKPPRGGHSNPVYAAMIESADQSVGRVTAKLDELGLTQDTLVVFFSDNGGVGGYRELGVMGGAITSNAPLRGGKGMLYEGGIRVPMIVRWPRRVRAGSRCRVPVIGLDFYPTFLEAAGIGARPARPLDGLSLVPLLRGADRLPRDAVFWHFPAYLEASQNTWRTTPAGAVRQGDYKLQEFFEDGRVELYNLRDDIAEKRDLSATMPGRARALRDLLVQWRESLGASVPTQPNPQYAPNATGKPDQPGVSP